MWMALLRWASAELHLASVRAQQLGLNCEEVVGLGIICDLTVELILARCNSVTGFCRHCTRHLA